MKLNPNSLHQCAESAAGVRGAGGYIAEAERLGYTKLEVLDWTSSAGDWYFAVSTDGKLWDILSQANNYPRPGFSYHLEPRQEPLEELCNLLQF